ncbi:MAG: hypothetical protein VX432_00090 [Candidatus Poribacteria bacterium]|nr:hypothetical protein [Candidatus Poribacteria bacterium]
MLAAIGSDESCRHLLHGEGCDVTLSWKLIFCAEKLSDVMYVSPWHIATCWGKELAVIGSIKSGTSHPKWRLAVPIRFLMEGLSQERQDILQYS